MSLIWPELCDLNNRHLLEITGACHPQLNVMLLIHLKKCAKDISLTQWC